MSTSEYLRTDELAALTGLSKRYWADLRSSGGGPAYIKLAKQVRYRRAEVERWLAERERVSTSSETELTATKA